MPHDGWQSGGGEALDFCILARADFPNQKLSGLLVVHHLASHVGEVELPAIQLFELGSLLLVVRVEFFGQRNLARVGKPLQSVIGFAMILDHFLRKFLHAGIAGPFGGEVQKHLDTSASYVDGIAKLFVKFGVKGYEPAHAKLKQQLAEYDAFVKAEILPRARKDFRLPPAIYAYSLKQYGVDVPPGGGRILRCLSRHADLVSQPCFQALTVWGLTAANAYRMCLPDVERLCAQVPPRSGHALACLAQNADRLSKDCRDSLTDLELLNGRATPQRGP